MSYNLSIERTPEDIEHARIEHAIRKNNKNSYMFYGILVIIILAFIIFVCICLAKQNIV